MSIDNFYWYASVLIFIPWLLLLLAPRGRYTEIVAVSAAIILLLAGAWFTFAYLRNGSGDGNLFTLNGLKNLFRDTHIVLAGWFNYLSFCLLVGVWQNQDADHHRIPHIFILPTLLLTLIAGPTGLLSYLLIRMVRTGKWEVK
jgi:Domain of unknown function (DUF4281)